MIRTFAVQQ